MEPIEHRARRVDGRRYITNNGGTYYGHTDFSGSEIDGRLRDCPAEPAPRSKGGGVMELSELVTLGAKVCGKPAPRAWVSGGLYAPRWQYRVFGAFSVLMFVSGMGANIRGTFVNYGTTANIRGEARRLNHPSLYACTVCSDTSGYCACDVG